MSVRSKYQTVAIASGASLSAAVDIKGLSVAAALIPAAWTAANLTFQASMDGTTYGDVYKLDGTEYTATVGSAADFILFMPSDFWFAEFIKIRSGTTGTPVNQAAARAITLILVDFDG